MKQTCARQFVYLAHICHNYCPGIADLAHCNGVVDAIVFQSGIMGAVASPQKDY